MLKKLKVQNYQEFVQKSEGVEDEDKLTKIMYECLIDTDLNKPFKEILKATTKLTDEILKAKENLATIIKVNDAEFGFIPDLENITFDEVMDMDFHMDNVKNHHKLMTILYRPIIDKKGDKYRVLDYTGTSGKAEKMKNLPLEYYFGAIGFFDRLGKDLQTVFPSYSPIHKEVATT